MLNTSLTLFLTSQTCYQQYKVIAILFCTLFTAIPTIFYTVNWHDTLKPVFITHQSDLTDVCFNGFHSILKLRAHPGCLLNKGPPRAHNLEWAFCLCPCQQQLFCKHVFLDQLILLWISSMKWEKNKLETRLQLFKRWISPFCG